ncbi:MAG: response regulator [Psychroserpens sp.]|uniref:response regulator n=1 Tax=Psychroserpens sp. TaxID=2020870 RepID=UPI003CB656F6
MQTNPIQIALADDDKDDRLFFKEAFKKLKIKSEVTTFEDGVVLMNYLNNVDHILPEILFLDLNMPKKSGIECLLEIKKTARLKDIVIAIYSTSASEQDIEKTFVLGANVYIKKPDDFNNLKKVLSEVVTTNWQFQTDKLNKANFLLRL